MKVFLSFSGSRSKHVAQALSGWLPQILHPIDCWFSDDIRSGQDWMSAILLGIASSDLGVICVTRANQERPWLNFEAGACAGVSKTKVAVPYLIDFEEILELKKPMEGLQFRRASKEETLRLVLDINQSREDDLQRTEEELQKGFDKWWPDLEVELEAARRIDDGRVESRQMEDKVDEVLSMLRSLAGPRVRSSALRANDTTLDPSQLLSPVDYGAVEKHNFPWLRSDVGALSVPLLGNFKAPRVLSALQVLGHDAGMRVLHDSGEVEYYSSANNTYRLKLFSGIWRRDPEQLAMMISASWTDGEEVVGRSEDGDEQQDQR